ncbi:MAG: hypothetical protein KDA59_05500, partial [Planctomycetales bacterium]|nr:hypothetical protein [Planctomycetales bacterium]
MANASLDDPRPSFYRERSPRWITSHSPPSLALFRRLPVNNAPTQVTVTAPSRLHFGLLSFGQSTGRQFGGVGMMVEQPSVTLRITWADRLTTTGPASDRAAEFAGRWLDFYELRGVRPCQVEVVDIPPQHVGLGAGTQLALSIAAGLNAWHGRVCPPPAELARSVGRGLRSAVGTYGFLEGGLIIERGKLPEETLSPLDSRLDVPDDWRVVLVRPRHFQGLAGDAEQRAFDALPAVSAAASESLARELREHLLPALAAADFDGFSASLYRYGHAAGLCFKALQGGPYNGSELTALVERIRSLGVAGVGQSSWGPTLFALTPSQTAAEDLRHALLADNTS